MLFGCFLAGSSVTYAQVPEAGIPAGGVGSYRATIGAGQVQVDFDKGTGTAMGITPVFGSSASLFAAPTSAEDLVAKAAAFIDANRAIFGVSSGNLDLRGRSLWDETAWIVNGTQFFSGHRVLEGYLQLVVALDGTLTILLPSTPFHCPSCLSTLPLARREATRLTTPGTSSSPELRTST